MRTASSVVFFFFLSSVVAIQGQGCTKNYYYNTYVTGRDTAIDGEGIPVDTGPEQVPGPNDCQNFVELGDLSLDLWGSPGTLFRFEINEEQRELLDQNQGGYSQDNDYTPGGGSGTYADAMVVQPFGSTTCALTGQVGISYPGQSSWHNTAEGPNIHLKTNAFDGDLEFPSGDTHIRLNNGQAGEGDSEISGILREDVALWVWRQLYGAPMATLAKMELSPWDEEFGNGTWGAMTLVQPYKGEFFENNFPDVTNVWEGAGDFNEVFGGGGFGGFECQWSVGEGCDTTVFENLTTTLLAAPQGDGFMAATSEVIDWPRYAQYICLVGLTGMWDGYSHNRNNDVIAFPESSGMFLLPYSTDITADHPWYLSSQYGEEFWGRAYLSQGCWFDRDCAAMTLNTCKDEVIPAFQALDVPGKVVMELEALRSAGLERDGDADRAAVMVNFYTAAPARVENNVNNFLLLLEQR